MHTIVALLAALAFSFPTQAQTYPSKVVRLVVPQGVGGTSEIVARSLAHKLSENLGRQFIVENKGGGAGIIATTEVARALQRPRSRARSPTATLCSRVTSVCLP